jgi:hypothetical protein
VMTAEVWRVAMTNTPRAMTGGAVKLALEEAETVVKRNGRQRPETTPSETAATAATAAAAVARGNIQEGGDTGGGRIAGPPTEANTTADRPLPQVKPSEYDRNWMGSPGASLLVSLHMNASAGDRQPRRGSSNDRTADRTRLWRPSRRVVE